MDINEKFIIWFDRINNSDLVRAGNKAVNLATLNSINIPVPLGFCITSDAYKAFCEELGLFYENKLSPQEMLDEGYQIRQKILNYPLPPEFSLELRDFYKKLINKDLSKEMHPVVVRPSPVGPNINSHTYKGILEAVSDITGIIELEKAVRIVWASAFSAKAIEYRIQNGNQFTFDDIAIIIQLMYEPEKGGIASFNPLSNNDSELIIESTYGLGQILISGPIVPDRFIWNRFSKELISSHISDKKYEEFFMDHQTIFAKALVREEKVSLNKDEITQVGRILEKVVTYASLPCAVEWFVNNDKFYVWQSYVLPRDKQKTQIKKPMPDANLYPLNDYFPGYISPIAYDLFAPIINKAFINLCKEFNLDMGSETEIIYLINNEFFINKNILKNIEPQLPDLSDYFNNKISKIFDISKLFFKLFRFVFKWNFELSKYRLLIHNLWMFKYSKSNKTDLYQHLIQIKAYGYGLFESLVHVKFIKAALSKIIHDYFEISLNKPINKICCKILTQNVSVRIQNSDKIFNSLIFKIKTNEDLKDIFSSYAADKILIKLNEIEAGQNFLEELKEFLSEFGYYKEKVLDPIFPTYIESPLSVLDDIKNELKSVKDPVNMSESDEKRLCLDALEKNFNFNFKFIFKIFLNLAQKFMIIEEEEAFHFTIYIPLLRRTLLELAAKLPFKEPEDIFYLSIDEIFEILNDISYPFTSLYSRIDHRKIDRQRMIEAAEREIVPEVSDIIEEGSLKGIPLSKGKFKGKAKIIKDMSVLPDIQKGDVIIAPYIDSAWQGLIKNAGAIITEFGGVLSLGSVTAREYGIPAVSGIENVFINFMDRELLEVNGDKGTVKKIPV